MGGTWAAARSALRCSTAPLASRAENNAQGARPCLQRISLACQRRLGSVELQLMAWDVPGRAGSLATGRWHCSGGAAESPSEPTGCSQSRESLGRAWGDMNSKETLPEWRCTVLTASLLWRLFKASRSSSKQEDWEGWKANSCAREAVTFLTVLLSLCQLHHAKLCFPNTWIVVLESAGGRAIWAFCSAWWSTQSKAGSV